MRWGAVVGQVLLLLVVRFGFELSLSLAPLFALVAVGLSSNVALSIWLRRGAEVTTRTLATVMLVDAGLLAALLALSGGPFNPFSIFFLVNVTLGAILLPARACWTLVVVSLGFFATLFLVPERSVGGLKLLGHAELMELHLQGMWVAFAAAATFIVYFIRRVMRVLAAQQETIAASRQLTGLATFVAGTAHELSTPLSTIAVASSELDRADLPASVREDVQLIRAEVRRCREILQELARGAGSPLGEPIVVRPASKWIAAALESLPGAERVRRPEATALDTLEVKGPSVALDRTLRSLVKNALQASADPAAVVSLEVTKKDQSICVSVRDTGAGMSADVLARAGQPFFTTKSAPDGIGLGLFLARSLCEQLGGQLSLESAVGRGTTVTLSLPTQEPRP